MKSDTSSLIVNASQNALQSESRSTFLSETGLHDVSRAQQAGFKVQP